MNWKLPTVVVASLLVTLLTGCLGGYQELPYTGGNPYGYAPPPNMPPGYAPPPTAPGANYGQPWQGSGQPGGYSQTQPTPGMQQTSPPAGAGSPAPGTQPGGSPQQPQDNTVAGDYPSGIPVPGKPGFVTSPYSEDQSQINVQGYPSGTPVRDPYTGGIFIVP